MLSELRAPDDEPGGDPFDHGPDGRLTSDRSEGERGGVVTVLADAAPGMRLGARMFPLQRWMARRGSVLGAEVAVTASLLDQLPTAPTMVVVVAPGVDMASVVDRLLPAARGTLGDGERVTVGVTGAVPVNPVTTHADALPAAVIEAVAAGQRSELTTMAGHCVLLLQRFVPATVSAVVHASPDRTTPVRVEGRSGETDAPVTFEVPADGRALREPLAWQPSTPGSRRSGRSIGRDTVRQLAALSRNAAVTAGESLMLSIALGPRGLVVLRCRPNAGRACRHEPVTRQRESPRLAGPPLPGRYRDRSPATR